MHVSLIERILAAALILLVSAWVMSMAARLIVDAAPVLLAIAGSGIVVLLVWRYVRERDTGW
jgi:hypothetical protein